jgi:hypothetical protein
LKVFMPALYRKPLIARVEIMRAELLFSPTRS